MALSSFFHHGGSAQKRLCKWEIRLENGFHFLRGSEHETLPFKVRGSVVLMTSDTIHHKGMRITLHGKRRTMHFITNDRERPPGVTTNAPLLNKATFLQEECNLGDGFGSKILKPGNYEFPFEFELPGHVPESIEGLTGNFITYGLTATIDRGVLAKDLVTRKPLRIIRTLGDDPIEFVDPQDVNGVWPDKIKYQFSTASRATIFGSRFSGDVELTPLIEKLRIGRIRVTLKEVRKTKTIPGPELTPGIGWTGMWKTETPIKEFYMDVPEGSEDEDPQLGLPMFKFKVSFDLPRSLKECRQSVEHNEWIKIKHVIHYDVLLHNADGHLSELRAHHGLRLFISPNLPLGEDNSVSGALETGAQSANLLQTLQTAPPDYGHHRLDPLYEDIDTSGFITPGVLTGANTPGLTLSRRNSNENQTSINTLANAGNTLPDELHRRLNLLEERDNGQSQREPAAPTPPSTGPSSGAPSRSHSHFELSNLGDAGRRSSLPKLTGYDMDALRQVPSYNTALRTPVRTPLADEPPAFHMTESSQPASPDHGLATHAAMQARQASTPGHVRF